jgi:hypothetical protein
MTKKYEKDPKNKPKIDEMPRGNISQPSEKNSHKKDFIQIIL